MKNDSNEKKAAFWYECFAVAQKHELLDEAMYAINKALQYQPNKSGLWFRKGHIYYKLKDYRNAEMALSRAIAIKPTNGKALVCIAFLKQDLGLYSEAKKWFERGVEVRPDDHDLITILANYNLKTDPQKAIELTEKALAIAPENDEAANIRDDALKMIANKKRKTKNSRNRK